MRFAIKHFASSDAVISREVPMLKSRSRQLSRDGFGTLASDRSRSRQDWEDRSLMTCLNEVVSYSILARLREPAIRDRINPTAQALGPPRLAATYLISRRTNRSPSTRLRVEVSHVRRSILRRTAGRRDSLDSMPRTPVDCAA